MQAQGPPINLTGIKHSLYSKTSARGAIFSRLCVSAISGRQNPPAHGSRLLDSCSMWMAYSGWTLRLLVVVTVAVLVCRGLSGAFLEPFDVWGALTAAALLQLPLAVARRLTPYPTTACTGLPPSGETGRVHTGSEAHGALTSIESALNNELDRSVEPSLTPSSRKLGAKTSPLSTVEQQRDKAPCKEPPRQGTSQTSSETSPVDRAKICARAWQLGLEASLTAMILLTAWVIGGRGTFSAGSAILWVLVVVVQGADWRWLLTSQKHTAPSMPSRISGNLGRQARAEKRSGLPQQSRLGIGKWISFTELRSGFAGRKFSGHPRQTRWVTARSSLTAAQGKAGGRIRLRIRSGIPRGGTARGQIAAISPKKPGVFQPATKRASPAPPRDLEDAFLSPDQWAALLWPEFNLLHTQVFQAMRRGFRKDGKEVLRGEICAAIPPGGRMAVIHVGFCPPFLHKPEVHLEQRSGPAAELRLSQALCHGLRLEAKLTQNAPAWTFIRIRLEAIGGAGHRSRLDQKMSAFAEKLSLE